MTVIAWDGTQLAADKWTSFGSVVGVTTKIHRVGDALVGGAGSTAVIKEMVEWIRRGCIAAEFPAVQRDVKEGCSLLVIRKVLRDRVILQYETTPYPLVIESPIWAIGTGRDLALMAMHLGETATSAVLLTAGFCSDCGGGVDFLTFEEDK